MLFDLREERKNVLSCCVVVRFQLQEKSVSSLSRFFLLLLPLHPPSLPPFRGFLPLLWLVSESCQISNGTKQAIFKRTPDARGGSRCQARDRRGVDVSNCMSQNYGCGIPTSSNHLVLEREVPERG